jgi:serine protease DegQ
MRRLWLIFSQTVTIVLAMLFVLATLRPEWLPARMMRAAPLGEINIQQLAPDGNPAAPPAPGSYADVVRQAMPSVVNILTSKEVRSANHPLLNDPFFKRFFGEQPSDQTERTPSLGSGVIVSPDGFILTNHHVIEGADDIEVLLADGRKLTARVIGNDPDTDLAVLRVEARGLPAIAFGNASSLRVGDAVLAIGNPFGVGQTVTSGIISGLGRSGLGINTFENFIQTDAAINPGNSGGALIDAHGALIGINTAIYSRSGGSMGIGFAIPVSTASQILEQIIKNGGVTRGWLGAELQELTPALAESFKLADARGVIIAGVVRGGPADKAGMKPGDLLRTIEDQPVPTPRSVLETVTNLSPGSNARVLVRRGETDKNLVVVIGTRPKPPAARR